MNSLYEIVCLEEFSNVVEQILLAQADLVLLDTQLSHQQKYDFC